jgi:hypothetical protein
LYYTDPSTNLALAATVPVVNGGFSATVPANCVFAITGPPVPPPAPMLQYSFCTNGLMLAWPGTATNFTLVTTTNPAPDATWCVVTNAPQLQDGQCQMLVTPGAAPQFFRLRWP